jgi:hypothetical protein
MAGASRFTRRSILLTIDQIANEIAKENDGRIEDVFAIEVRLRRELERRPELLDLDKMARDLRKFWEEAHHKVLSHASGVFVPGVFVTVAPKLRVKMRKLKLPHDVAAWGETATEARDNYLRVFEQQDAYRAARMVEYAEHGDCAYLGDLEAKLHGYLPSPKDDDVLAEPPAIERKDDGEGS